MAQASVDIAMEKTSQEILEACNVIKTMVTDVSKYNWKTSGRIQQQESCSPRSFIIMKIQRIQTEKS